MVINWPNLKYYCVSGNGKAWEEGERQMEWSEHIHLLIKFTLLNGHGPWCPKTIMVLMVTSKITDDKCNNNEKVSNTVRITKMWQRHKMSKCWWENGANRLAQDKAATDLQCVYLQSARKLECNKTRYACICILSNWSYHSSAYQGSSRSNDIRVKRTWGTEKGGKPLEGLESQEAGSADAWLRLLQFFGVA